jgi:hypothetical protein
MKTPNESHPRLLCRVVRGWSMIAGDPATGAAARHVAACPACQRFFAASSALDARLRAAAPRQAQALPAGFEQRLERALAPLTREATTAAEADSGVGSRWVLWSFFGSAATVAAALAVFVLMRPVDAPPVGPEFAIDRPAETPALEISPASGGVLLGLAQENPLQREIDHVYADAQDALRFLALNFIPGSETADAPSS